MNIRPEEDSFEGCLLPAQYNSLVRRARFGASEAERSLMLAVLKDAIRICLSDRNAATRERRLRFEETRRWFEDSATGIFTYENLCDVLGIDADRVRARLRFNPPSRRTAIPCGRSKGRGRR